MTTVVDSRDYINQSGVDGNPQFRSQCPHCGNIHLYTHKSAIRIFGAQKSVVVTCDHKFTEGSGYKSRAFGGCGKRYVMDIRVDVRATSIPLTE